MIIPEAPLVRRGVPVPGGARRTTIVIAAFLLATAFVLEGTPTATAASAFTNNVMAFAFAPCGGEKPGVCPDPGQRNDSGRMSGRQHRDAKHHRNKS